MTKVNHLARTVSPSLFKAAPKIHDQLMRSTFESLMSCSGLDDVQWRQATLPIKYGDFGLSSVESICASAYISVGHV